MAPRRSPSTAATLYRLTDLTCLREAIKRKYLENTDRFVALDCSVAERTAVLVNGSIETERARWADRVESLIEEPIEARNATAAAVLVIEASDGVAWAITYGMGFLLLEQDHVDAGFGQRLAIRIAAPDKLNALTRKTLDDRAKVDRSSIPAGAPLRGFGIGGFGELVTRVAGTAELGGLSVGTTFKMRGSDSVNLPLARTPKELLADLDIIDTALSAPAQKDLEVLEQLIAVKKGSRLAAELEDRLVDVLGSRHADGLACAWPHESINENGTPESFVIKGRGPRTTRSGVPALHDIAESIDRDRVRESLDRVKIQLFRDPDGQEPLSPDIPLRKWIAFEKTVDGRRYFLHDGAWYLMDDAYAVELAARVQQIFDRQWPERLPPWPANSPGDKVEEKHYNQLAADSCGGVLLDRKLIRTSQNPRGFETCDILTPDGSLVHIKNIDSSAPASHLFAQGHNSAHSLMSDNQARQELARLVESVGGDPALVTAKPRAVVFGIARRSGAPMTAGTLYSFSQVTLVRTVNDLEARGIAVYVVPIDNGPARAS